MSQRSVDYPYMKFDGNSWSNLEENLLFNYDKYILDYITYFNQPRDYSNDLSHCTISHLKHTFYDDLLFFTGECYYNWITYAYNLRKKSTQPFKKDMDFLINNQNDIFLTFNYTPTLEEIYKIPAENILYIHGNINEISKDNLYEYHLLNDKKNSFINSSLCRHLQFGNPKNDPNEILKKIDKIIPPLSKNDMFQWKKLKENINYICNWSFKNLYKNQKNLKDFLCSKLIEKVIVIGHSFDGIDEPYYSNVIIPITQKSIWKFYCHTKDSEKRAFQFISKYNLHTDDSPCLHYED